METFWNKLNEIQTQTISDLPSPTLTLQKVNKITSSKSSISGSRSSSKGTSVENKRKLPKQESQHHDIIEQVSPRALTSSVTESDSISETESNRMYPSDNEFVNKSKVIPDQTNKNNEMLKDVIEVLEQSASKVLNSSSSNKRKKHSKFAISSESNLQKEDELGTKILERSASEVSSLTTRKERDKHIKCDIYSDTNLDEKEIITKVQERNIIKASSQERKKEPKFSNESNLYKETETVVRNELVAKMKRVETAEKISVKRPITQISRYSTSDSETGSCDKESETSFKNEEDVIPTKVLVKDKKTVEKNPVKRYINSFCFFKLKYLLIQ